MIDASTLATLQNARSEAAGQTVMQRARMHAQQQHAEAVGKDFESMFITAMLEPMFGDSVGDTMFGDDETKEVYKALMIEQYGRKITESGGIGIADYVKRELLRQQEVTP